MQSIKPIEVFFEIVEKTCYHSQLVQTSKRQHANSTKNSKLEIDDQRWRKLTLRLFINSIGSEKNLIF